MLRSFRVRLSFVLLVLSPSFMLPPTLGFSGGDSQQPPPSPSSVGDSNGNQPIYNRAYLDLFGGWGGEGLPNRFAGDFDLILSLGPTLRDFYLNPDDHSRSYMDFRFGSTFGINSPHETNDEADHAADSLLARTIYATYMFSVSDHERVKVGLGRDSVRPTEEYEDRFANGYETHRWRVPSMAHQAATIGPGGIKGDVAWTRKDSQGDVLSITAEIFENGSPTILPGMVQDASVFDRTGEEGMGAMVRLHMNRERGTPSKGAVAGDAVSTTGNVCAAALPDGNAFAQMNGTFCKQTEAPSFLRLAPLSVIGQVDVYAGTGDEREGSAYSGRVSCEVQRLTLMTGLEGASNLVSNYQAPGQSVTGDALAYGASCRLFHYSDDEAQNRRGTSIDARIAVECREPIFEDSGDNLRPSKLAFLSITCSF